MPHEIDRVLRAFSRQPLFIEPSKAEEIVSMLALRASGEDRAPVEARPAARGRIEGGDGVIHVLPVFGTIFPRSNMLAEMSGGVSMQMFQAAFQECAADEDCAAIVLEFDSPGGVVDMVPETAAMIRAARNGKRPVISVANTMAASAAYWLAAAADELVVTPSAQVGSIGVYTMHDDLSAAMEQQGITRTYVAAGPRKVEGHPFAPLDDEARAALMENIRYVYDMFVRDVARDRGVDAAVVRADPVAGKPHFGGGRMYPARTAVSLGMADRVATMDAVLRRAAGTKRRRGTSAARARLALARR